jgi:hypothetical protein
MDHKAFLGFLQGVISYDIVYLHKYILLSIKLTFPKLRKIMSLDYQLVFEIPKLKLKFKFL